MARRIWSTSRRTFTHRVGLGLGLVAAATACCFHMPP